MWQYKIDIFTTHTVLLQLIEQNKSWIMACYGDLILVSESPPNFCQSSDLNSYKNNLKEADQNTSLRVLKTNPH